MAPGQNDIRSDISQRRTYCSQISPAERQPFPVPLFRANAFHNSHRSRSCWRFLYCARTDPTVGHSSTDNKLARWWTKSGISKDWHEFCSKFVIILRKIFFYSAIDLNARIKPWPADLQLSVSLSSKTAISANKKLVFTHSVHESSSTICYQLLRFSHRIL